MHLRAIVAARAAVADKRGEEHVAALVVNAAEARAALFPDQRCGRGRGVRAERPGVARRVASGGLGRGAVGAPKHASVARVYGCRQDDHDEWPQHCERQRRPQKASRAPCCMVHAADAYSKLK